jgi:hypothetical protein
MRAFYVPDGDRYLATDHTRGPWDPGAQHGGPVSALLAHALERAHPRPDAQVARVSIDLLAPVPIAPLAVTTEVVRAGRKVELLAATLAVDGRPFALARVWRIRTADVGVPDAPGHVLATPADGHEPEFFPGLADVGWHRSIEARFLEGAWNEPGAASAWFRLRVPVVAGREPTPVERVLAVADAGNGISAPLEFTRYLFVNCDLTVSLHRLPVGEWVHLAAETRVEPRGGGPGPGPGGGGAPPPAAWRDRKPRPGALTADAVTSWAGQTSSACSRRSAPRSAVPPKRLNRSPPEAWGNDPQVMFAVDLELEYLAENLRVAVPAARRRELSLP